MCIRDRPTIDNIHRIHTRSSGYSENTSQNTVPNMPDLNSIQGATALKLDQEVKEESVSKKQEDLVSGISLENASYFENNLNQDQKEEQEEVIIDDISLYEEKPQTEPEINNLQDGSSPQLFSDEGYLDTSSEDSNDENFKEEENDFEIPAFLRKQKS